MTTLNASLGLRQTRDARGRPMHPLDEIREAMVEAGCPEDVIEARLAGHVDEVRRWRGREARRMSYTGSRR